MRRLLRPASLVQEQRAAGSLPAPALPARADRPPAAPVSHSLRGVTGVGVFVLCILLGGNSAVVAAPPPPPGYGLASQRADGHIRYGFDLAGRGAVYSAQAEFNQALQVVAQVLDTQAGVQDHGRALDAGLRAMAEAEELAPEDAHRGGSLDLSRLIATHRTPVLREADPRKLTPLIALQSYYSYAKEQLAVAGGHEPGASSALYGLGRLQGVLGRGQSVPTAITMHQAAMLVDANNFLAANELAVLMFRHGELEEARLLLVHSVRLAPRSETWHNMAVVCARLGRADDARSA